MAWAFVVWALTGLTLTRTEYVFPTETACSTARRIELEKPVTGWRSVGWCRTPLDESE